MSTIVYVILGVIIIVLLFYVYIYYFSPTTTYSSSIWLNSSNPPITSITNPNTTNFSYGVWIYINTWSSASMNLFNVKNGSSGKTLFSLDLPTTSPTLTATIYTSPTACGTTISPNTITITNNIGIQRWTYVIVSVNTNIVDCYLDGKLVTSTQLTGVPIISCSNYSPNINYGTGSDIYLSNFQRWITATDPATAMSYYGYKPATSALSTYGVNLRLIKDNVEQTAIKIF